MECECGLNYDPDDPDEEKNHERIHKEYQLGPDIPAVRLLSRIETIDDLPVYVVDKTIPCEIRHAIAGVALVACRYIPGSPAGYDGTITERDERLFIAADGSRVIAMVLTALDDVFWRFNWKDDLSIKFESREPIEKRRIKVARAWTAADYQRKGVANQLIKIACKTLPCDIADLGWELPFTESGAHLVKQLCPDFSWGCGDLFTLREIIDKQ